MKGRRGGGGGNWDWKSSWTDRDVRQSLHVERGERDETRRMGKVGLRTREPSIMHVARPRCDRQINSTENGGTKKQWKSERERESSLGAVRLRFSRLAKRLDVPAYEEIFLSDSANHRARRPFSRLPIPGRFSFWIHRSRIFPNSSGSSGSSDVNSMLIEK